MLRLLFIPLASSSLMAAAPPRDEGWRRRRGARFDGTATTGAELLAAPFELRVTWKRTLGAGYFGIVVSGGHAATMFLDGTKDFVVSLSSKSGEEHWRLPLGEAFPGRDGSTGGPVSTPAIDNGIVYEHHRPARGRMDNARAEN